VGARQGGGNLEEEVEEEGKKASVVAPEAVQRSEVEHLAILAWTWGREAPVEGHS
jgi:hypothetical protein